MPLKLKRTCDDGGGVDTEQKALSSFGLGVFLHFFSSSRDDGFYHVTRETTRTCVIFFPFFFRNDGPLVKFLGRKNAHDDDDDDDDAQNKTINRHSEILTFYYASYTHNVYRAIRIYDCGKYTFRGIRFARRSMDARFARVRIERWSERDCRSRGKIRLTERQIKEKKRRIE